MLNFFTSYLGGTHGSAKSAQDFLKALLACAESVRVISPQKQELPDSLFESKLVSPKWFAMPRDLKLPRTFWQTRRCHLRQWINGQFALYRLKEFRKGGITIVNGWASYKEWRTFRHNFTGPKVIIVRESLRHFTGPDRNLPTSLLLKSVVEFDFLIFVSKRVSNEWRQYDEINNIPHAVLQNCCEEENAQYYISRDKVEVRSQFGLTDPDFVLLCPGTIEHRKGQDLLLDIVDQLDRKIPSLKILFVGDPATQWGRDLVCRMNDTKHHGKIIYLHSRPEILDLLFASDALIFPSRAEALPRTILEAMVMKTPVVASDVDGIPELVEDGKTGLIFPSENRESLLQAIMRLHADIDFRLKLSDAGSKKYWAGFSRRHQFERMQRVLQKINENFLLSQQDHFS